MSCNKNINRICVIITVIAVLVTVLFMNGSVLGIAADDSVSFGYENKIFDDSYVHTIDIEMDDFDSLIENATAEEYSAADVTIDGEKIKNVGIRCKGNTSLSTVSQLDSERYSFKIEFDCYEASGNYYGLDKLCLNNLIQDYTMMKDYITYKLMNEFGVSSPLVSYCFITVNGEDWGLYLAVEAVEESFLERNYGSNYGELYKPDTMSMGGGRGNGRDFDMKNMDFDQLGIENPFERKSKDDSSGIKEDDSSGEGSTEENNRGDSEKPSEPPTGFPEGDSNNESSESDGSSDVKGGFPGGGPMGMGSDASKIKYVDDDTDSYSTIFDSAKTTISNSDKKRLVSAIKSLSEGIENSDSEAIESAVDTEALMRYMVVHNFVVNGDSYTGSMIHNYYLYEEDGLMTMLPWDYNLGFGTFQGQDATSIVNDPIDTPQNITDSDTDRPMFSWITSCDEYTEKYHEYFQEFIDKFYTSGYLNELISTTYEMIYDYVDRDPTKFCTTEEFEKAVQTIDEFVTLRCESIQGQLQGTIPSTDSGQKADSSNLIDASSITLTDMGSMGGGMGGGPGDDHSGGAGGDHSGGPFGSSTEGQSGENSGEPSENGNNSFVGGGFPGGGDNPFGNGGFPGGGDNPFGNGEFPGGGDNPFAVSTVTATDYIYLGASGGAIILAIAFALFFKRRRIR